MAGVELTGTCSVAYRPEKTCTSVPHAGAVILIDFFFVLRRVGLRES
jgi:hypothetical protein